MTSASWRKSAEISKNAGRNRFKTCGPRIIPVRIIPRMLGSFNFKKIDPSRSPSKKMSAREVSIFNPKIAFIAPFIRFFVNMSPQHLTIQILYLRKERKKYDSRIKLQ